MSVIRNWGLFNRKDQRNLNSSPYARSQHPARRAEPRRTEAQQSEGWVSNMFSFIANLGFGSSQSLDEDDLDLENPKPRTTDTNRARNVNVRVGRLIAPMPPRERREVPQIQPQAVNYQPIASSSVIKPPPPPPSSNAPDFGLNGTSLLEWAEKKAQSKTSLNEKELKALQAVIKQCDNERTYEPEKLRFAPRAQSTPTNLSDNALAPPASGTSDAALTSTRSFSISNSTSLPTFKNNVPSTGAPKRMLKTDPNGPIRLRGAGRARSTPASSRRATARLIPRELPKADTSKRRRIFEESDDSSEVGVAPALSSSQSAPAVGSNGSGANLSMPPRLPRATILRPHTAPLVSSPLRNVVNSSPPVSPPRNKRSSPTHSSTIADANTSINTNSSQTRTASFLSDVIEKVTPPPQIPDVVNPYEAAHPFKIPYKPISKRARDRSTRNKSKPEKKEEKEVEKGEEKEKVSKKELSAKEIIEATVPKGAQRSRPPPKFSQQKDENPEPYSAPIVVELVEEQAPAKKTRKVTIEEVDEDEGNGKTTSSYIKPTEVIEPQDSGSSSIRTSPAPPNNLFASSKPSIFGPGKSSLPKEPSKLRKSFLADEEENDTPKPTEISSFFSMSKTTTPATPLVEVQEKRDPKDIALSLPVSDLPNFKFNIPQAPVALDYPEARAAAKALPISELPTFDFSKPPKVSANAAPDLTTTSVPAVQGFNYAASGFKQAPVSKDSWKCGVCMVENSVERNKKCISCEEPYPGAEKESSPPSPKLTASDFAAAIKKQMGEAAIPTPPAAPLGFDWKAAGIAPPKAKSAGAWNCSLCSLENPSTETEKCKHCENPK